MKKYLLLLLPFVVILNSCKKINGFEVTGGNYQPLTAGSSWTYKIDYGTTVFGPDTSVIVMSNQTSTINNKVYQLASWQQLSSPSTLDTNYYYVKDHQYSTFATIAASTGGSSVSYSYDMLYLKDNLPVGGTWTVNTATLTLNGKIVEKGISKTVSGKTYTNVIHTNVTVAINSQSVTGSISNDYYMAPGVGIIQIQIIDPSTATNITEDLIAYTIK